METKRMSRRKKLLPAGGIVLIALAAAFFLYASDYYHADGEALAVLAQEGGNHAQFGNYGPQKGDSPATITAAEQQEQTVEAVSAFLASAR